MNSLHLFTPLWRSPENFEKVYQSIPKVPDIKWIVVKADSYKLDINVSDYYNLTLISIPISDDRFNLHHKVNAAIDQMSQGHFYGLDDDTLFCPNTYELWKKYGSNYKMIMGAQVDPYGSARAAVAPTPGVTDGAQGMIDTSIVKKIKIGNYNIDSCADGTFLLRCWNECLPDERIIVDELISYYNYQVYYKST